MRATVISLWTVLFLLAAGLTGASAAPVDEQVIRITARKFEHNPRVITLKKGVPVVLELTSLDRIHGFNLPDFGLRTDIVPGKVARIRFTPDKAGEFAFFCDVFCGDGHEEMSGTLIVKD